MSDHYTALLTISSTKTETKSGGYNKPDTTDRNTTEVVKLVVKADSLEKLRSKLAAHVALIEE